MMNKKIIVVGAGILGASLAYHLAKAGADVLVFDAAPHAGGVATPNSFAWINASWGNPPDYVKLRMRSMALWRNLADVHADLAVNCCGGLSWDLPEAELREYCSQHHALGYGTKLVQLADIERLEPQLSSPPPLGVFVGVEGAIEPEAAARGFMVAAMSLGAKFMTSCTVQGLVLAGDRVDGVVTNAGKFLADEVVLAAGAQTRGLLKACGLEFNLEAPAGMLVHSKPVGRKLNGLVMAPELHIRQTADGRLVAGSDYGGAQPGSDPASAAARLFANVQSFLRGGEILEMDFYTLGYRPTPADGFPAVGRPRQLKQLYIAALHSGVTLAPAVGLFGAHEILHDHRDGLLAPYHPDRLIT